MHDLIIVGAGTAGCVLAERLTRSGKLRVLLAEAGGKPSSRFVGIPAAVPKLFRTDLDWAFESEPQAGAAGRRILTPHGRMLGGSANLNFQIHACTLGVAVVAPHSRGSVTLRSAEPAAAPLIDFNLLSDPMASTRSAAFRSAAGSENRSNPATVTRNRR